MSSQPDALGPVGNVLMALLLTALCAGSFFTTVGRQFQVRPRLLPGSGAGLGHGARHAPRCTPLAS